MLAPRPKSQRLLETIQIVLTFVSVCAVVDATRSLSPPTRPAGYYSALPQQSEHSVDRRLGDLARVERKRREAEQQANRRNLDVPTTASAAHA